MQKRWARTALCLALVSVSACSNAADGGTAAGGRRLETDATVAGAVLDPATAAGADGRNEAATPGAASNKPNAKAAAKSGNAATPGVSSGTIKLGTIYSSDRGNLGAAFGRENRELPDERDVFNAIAGYINRNGGIAGRKIEGVFVDIQFTNGSTAAQREQEMCAAWTEDTKVFAVVGLEAFNQGRMLCFPRAGVAVVDGYRHANNIDEEMVRQFNGHFFNPSAVSIDRYWKRWIDELWANGYFDQKDRTRVGIIFTDHPSHQRGLDKAIRPALAARGITLTDHQAITPLDDLDTLARAQQDIQSAMVRFRSRGVTHILDPTQLLPLAAGPNEQQKYRPRWGVVASHAPVDLTGADTSMQLRNAMGTTIFVASRQERNATPVLKLCEDLVAKAGLEDANKVDDYCEPLFFLHDALRGANSVSAAALSAALPLASVRLLPGMFAPPHFAHGPLGGGTVRNIAYDFACHERGGDSEAENYDNCWVYRGPPYTL